MKAICSSEYELEESEQDGFVFSRAHKLADLFLVQSRILSQEGRDALRSGGQEVVLLKVGDTLRGLLVEQLGAGCVNLR